MYYSFYPSSDFEHREKVSPCPKYKNCSFCNGVNGASSKFKGSEESESKQKNYSFYQSSDSDSDCSDCEVMEREQWEKVLAQRKRQVDEIYSNLKKETCFKDFSSQKVEEEKKRSEEKVFPCPNFENCSFCNGNVSGDDKRFKREEECEDACDSKVGDDDVEFKCDSFDQGHVDVDVDGDGFGLDDKDDDLEEKDLINEKEKIKETDEYKQAMEMEWASRQQELLIQAKEAQRLRKRKKDEREMQRRQKERIEEVRETQKKGEEFIKMKEQMQVEVRKRLEELEKRCNDMSSLLCGLGIQIAGPNKVYDAYKRALFKFHPDRVSKTDIREQVEAEEKFKLIMRMKDKFLFTK